jgi:ATP-dependent Clp protease ATP-binding subunit ClpA
MDEQESPHPNTFDFTTRLVEAPQLPPLLPGREPTRGVRRLIADAEGEARKFGHDYLSTGHILLAMLGADHGVAYRVLRDLGITHAAVLAEVCRIQGGGDE